MKTWKVIVSEGDEKTVEAERFEEHLRHFEEHGRAPANYAKFYIGEKLIRYFLNYDKIEFIGEANV